VWFGSRTYVTGAANADALDSAAIAITSRFIDAPRETTDILRARIIAEMRIFDGITGRH
jgi:hypothetical protein